MAYSLILTVIFISDPQIQCPKEDELTSCSAMPRLLVTMTAVLMNLAVVYASCYQQSPTQVSRFIPFCDYSMNLIHSLEIEAATVECASLVEIVSNFKIQYPAGYVNRQPCHHGHFLHIGGKVKYLSSHS